MRPRISRWLRVLPLATTLSLALASVPPGVSAEQPSPQRSDAKLKERDRYRREWKRLQAEDRLDEAAAVAEKVVAIERELASGGIDDLAESLSDLADLHMAREDFAAARQTLLELRTLCEKRLGPGHWRSRDARLSQEHLKKLEQLTPDQRQLIRRGDHLMDRVRELCKEGKFREALPRAQEARRVWASVLGEDHWLTGTAAAWLGFLYDDLDDLPHAEEAYRYALANRKRWFGEDHPDFARELDNLASVLLRRGDSAQAEPLRKQALEIRRKVLGTRNDEYAASLHNLAFLYRQKKDYHRAEELFRQALEIKKQTIGDKDPRYAETLDALAGLYDQTHDYARAEALLTQAQAVRKEALGDSHPDYARGLSNLAHLYLEIADYSRAQACLREALAIQQKTYGAKHPSYARALDRLGDAYLRAGQYDEARPLYLQEAEIWKKTPDGGGEEYAHCLNQLSLVYGETNDPRKAEQCLLEAVAIQKRLHIDKTPDSLTTLRNLAQFYAGQEDYDRALLLMRRVVAEWKQLLGADYPRSRAGREEWAGLLQGAAVSAERKGDFAKARQLRREVLDAAIQLWGKDHWRTADARLGLDIPERMSKATPAQRARELQADELLRQVSQLDKQKLHRQAVPLARQMLQIRTEIFGEQNRLTIDALDWLGYLLNESGQYAEAKPVLLQAVARYRQLLGTNHPAYADALNKLAWLSLRTGACGDSIRAFREVLAVREKVLGREHPNYARTISDLTNALDQLAGQQMEQGDFKSARKNRQEILSLRTNFFGEKHWRVTDARLRLADVDQLEKLTAEQRQRLREAERLHERVLALHEKDHDREALPLAKRAYETRQQLLGEDHYLSLRSLNALALVHTRLADYHRAEALRTRLVRLTRQVYGENHPDYATELHNLASLDDALGAHARAEPLYRQALAIGRAVEGEDSSAYAGTLNNLALNCGKRGDPAQEEFLLRQALAIHKRTVGPRHPKYAAVLGNLAMTYSSRGLLDRAEPLLQEASGILREAGRGKDPLYAWTLRCLANLYKTREEYARAEPLYRQALDIDAAVAGTKSPSYAAALQELAILYLNQRDYARCAPLLEEALATTRAVFGPDHPETADVLQELGWLHDRQGKYAHAEALYRQALEIRGRALGKRDVRYADSLFDLAWLYQETRDFARAEPLYREALAIKKEVLGEHHPKYAHLLDEAGGLYAYMGDYDRALHLRRRALEIRREISGQKGSDYASSLSNLALVYESKNDDAKAEALYREAQAIIERTEGETSFNLSTNLLNLGALYSKKGDATAAEPLLRRAVELRRRLVGPKHPAYALAVYHLGWLSLRKQQYAQSEALFREALAVYREAFGEHHPDYAKCVYALANLQAWRQEWDQAERLAREALEIHRTHLQQTAAAQSERQQLASAEDTRSELDLYLSVALRAREGVGRAYDQVLRWKGSVSSRQGEMRRLRRALQAAGKPDAIHLYDRLGTATARLAALARSTPDADDPGKLARQLEETSAEIERLEGALAQASAAFREEQKRQRQQCSAEEIRAALPAGTVLVDLLDYWDFDPRRHSDRDSIWEHRDGSQRRLVAFVTRPDRPGVQAIDLGPTWALAGAVDDWRKTFGQPWADGRDPGRDLRRLFWKKLASACAGGRVLLISPDGVLNRLPWGALPGGKPGTYLVEEMAIAVVPVPSRLPQILADRGPSSQAASLLLVGDVRFDGLPGMPDQEAVAYTAPRGSRGGGGLHWPELPGTRAEADAIKSIFQACFPGARVRDLRQAGATEAAVRRDAPRNRYLHFATHGYFAPAQLRSRLAAVSRSPGSDSGSLFDQRDVAGFHPGLLAGLVLAGANRAVDFDYDDGILTALEIEALDLSDVELATLSACETGLGQSAAGEGLLGLQRAFQTAGAHSVVAGLWQVPDQATQLLMRRFYENLWQHRMGRLEALRQAQLWMLKEVPRQTSLTRGLEVQEEAIPKDGRLPPYYWAAFVLSGDWR